MSKIIEKIAAYQLTICLETNKLLPECQSGGTGQNIPPAWIYPEVKAA